MEDFDFDIPELDPEEIKRARKHAMKDMSNETSNTQNTIKLPGETAAGTPISVRGSGEVEGKASK